jgi:hypothetical protein
VVVAVSIVVILVFFQNFLFARCDHNIKRIREFYQEEKNSLDVVFIGASEVYTGFSPGYAYDNYGFTSYMYAMESNQGSLYKSQLKEILAHQNPQIIFVEIFGFLRSSDEGLFDEARLRNLIEGMPLSDNKLETIFQYPYEDKISCLFPFIKYHGDISIAKGRLSITLKQLIATNESPSIKGMTTQAFVYDGIGDVDGENYESKCQISPKTEEYLIDFLNYCRSEGLDNVVFVNFPRYIEDEQNHSLLARVDQVGGIVSDYGFQFIDLQHTMNEIGIDVTHDYFNTHHHNIYGQIKISDYFGKLVRDVYGIIPMKQSEENTAQWKQCAVSTMKFFKLAHQAVNDGNPLWLNEYADEWLFANVE